MKKRRVNEIVISGRKIGPMHPPLVIAEIGINHDGNFDKAIQMIDDAAAAGCECVKFQTHIPEDEMVPNKVIPANASLPIWDIISRCALTEVEEVKLKEYTEKKGMIFLSTPFSRKAVDRLRKIGVGAYKIGSGECNNYPLVEYIAQDRKPVILSTGMNDIPSIRKAVLILRKYNAPFALLHCTSIYPTPFDKIRLGALTELKKAFPNVVLGLSDHSESIYPSLGAVALGACILERHFTSSKKWPGPDIPISMDPNELKELILASKIIYEASGGQKRILKEEAATINFAYACVVAIRDIAKNERFSNNNIWVKRPGTGEIKAVHFEKILGKKARVSIRNNTQIKWSWIGD